MLVVVIALVSAFLFALAAALQQRAALREESPDERAGIGIGLLGKLLRRPLWLAGLGIDAIGGVLQAVALGIGRLAVVEPVSATTVVFALPLGKRLTGQHVGRREIAGAAAVMLGLAVFLLASEPADGRDDAPAHRWAVAFGLIAVAVVVLCAIGLRAKASVRAAAFGAASGLGFGVCAALTKVVIDHLDEGFLAIFDVWHFYALVLVGVLSTALNQAALQAGLLAPAVAASMIADPLVSVLLGVGVLDERIHDRPSTLVVCLLAFAVMAAGLVALARPPRQPPEVTPRGSPLPSP